VNFINGLSKSKTFSLINYSDFVTTKDKAFVCRSLNDKLAKEHEFCTVAGTTRQEPQLSAAASLRPLFLHDISPSK